MELVKGDQRPDGGDAVEVVTRVLYEVFPPPRTPPHAPPLEPPLAEEMAGAMYLRRFANFVVELAERRGRSVRQVVEELGNPTRFFARAVRNAGGPAWSGTPAMFLTSRLQLHLAREEEDRGQW